MPHNLFGERFFSHRQPAWHNLGLVCEDQVSAYDAASRIGLYEVQLQPLCLPDGMVVPQRAIVRRPTADDPQVRVFGVVGPEYELLDPGTFARVWDEHVTRYVETVGVLGRGEAMFITTKLPTFGVQDDEVNSYLMAANWMDGTRAIELRITPVRVVCQNTLIAALESFTYKYRVVHDSGARDRMGSWLADMYERAIHQAEVLQETFSILAAKHVNDQEISFVLEKAYPGPKPVNPNAPPSVLVQRAEVNERTLRHAVLRREAVLELFNGRGTGMDLVATRGTAWGLYNAVTELEDYRPGRSPRSIGESALFGGRAQAKIVALDACASVAKGIADLDEPGSAATSVEV